MKSNLAISSECIAAFCRKWRVTELCLFGSVLRDDFRPESDVDVLVSFEESARITLWDMSDMVVELENLLGRKVDLVEKSGLQNPYRRNEILSSCEVVYAA